MTSTKSRTAALLLAILLGSLGVHRFYVGKTGTGVLQIISWIVLPVLIIWVWVDIIMIVTGNFTDAHGNKITSWSN